MYQKWDININKINSFQICSKRAPKIQVSDLSEHLETSGHQFEMERRGPPRAVENGAVESFHRKKGEETGSEKCLSNIYVFLYHEIICFFGICFFGIHGRRWQVLEFLYRC